MTNQTYLQYSVTPYFIMEKEKKSAQNYEEFLTTN